MTQVAGRLAALAVGWRWSAVHHGVLRGGGAGGESTTGPPEARLHAGVVRSAAGARDAGSDGWSPPTSMSAAASAAHRSVRTRPDRRARRHVVAYLQQTLAGVRARGETHEYQVLLASRARSRSP